MRCWSYTTWRNTTIAGNTIEVGDTGIAFKVDNAGDRVEQVTVTENRIRISGNNAAIQLETGGDSKGGRISGALIARNTVEGRVDIGINVVSGAIRGQSGIVKGVRILDNRVQLTGSRDRYCCAGVVVQAGSDDPSFARMVRPPRYLDDNVVLDVLVRGNTIGGTLDTGVSLNAGSGAGGRRNRLAGIRVERNTVRTTKPGIGVGISVGDGMPASNRYATDNLVTGVLIDANRITTGTGPYPENAGGGWGAGGVVIAGGGRFGSSNAVRDVRITRNALVTAYVGIRVIGGAWPSARGNSVSCVRLASNRITGAHEAVSVIANHRGARGNRATLGC